MTTPYICGELLNKTIFFFKILGKPSIFTVIFKQNALDFKGLVNRLFGLSIQQVVLTISDVLVVNGNPPESPRTTVSGIFSLRHIYRLRAYFWIRSIPVLV